MVKRLTGLTESTAVTAILPILEESADLKGAIDSVLAQDGVTLEIVVSDDGGDEATRRVLLDYHGRFPGRFRLLFSARPIRSNLVVARAIAAARGDLVAMIEPNDRWVSSAKAATQARFLAEEQACAACFHGAVGADARGEATASADGRFTLVTATDFVADFAIPPSTVMFRRSAIAAMPPAYAGAPMADWPLYELAARSGPFGRLEAPFTRCGPPRARSGRTFGEYLRAVAEEQGQPVSLGDVAIEARCREGMLWDDGWCSPRLSLAVRARKPVRRIGVSLWNPDSDPAFAGNTIKVRLAHHTFVREAVALGTQLEVPFAVDLAPGDLFGLDIESAASYRAKNDVRPLGLVVLGFSFT